jgi:transmembrane sensor
MNLESNYSDDTLPNLHQIAADFQARLDTDPGNSDVEAALAAWLAQALAHRLAYAEIASMYYTSAAFAPELLAIRTGTGSHALKPTGSALSSTTRRRVFGASATRWSAAALGVLTLVLAFTGPRIWQNQRASALSLVGEVKQVELADGSVLQLDSDTAVRVTLQADQRRLQLLRGRLHVRVAHNEAAPLTVQAGATRATAIGTQFSVSVNGVIDVDQGLVRVQRGEQQLLLSAGQTTDNARVIQSSDLQVPDWSRKQLHIDKLSLRTALEQLSGYLPARLWIRDDPRFSRPISAILDLNKPVATFDQLVTAHGAQIERYPYIWVVHF